MKWVLIVIFAGYNGGYPTGFTQEFDTPKACINAKAVIDSYESKINDFARVVCLPKGDIK